MQHLTHCLSFWFFHFFIPLASILCSFMNEHSQWRNVEWLKIQESNRYQIYSIIITWIIACLLNKFSKLVFILCFIHQCVLNWFLISIFFLLCQEGQTLQTLWPLLSLHLAGRNFPLWQDSRSLVACLLMTFSWWSKSGLNCSWRNSSSVTQNLTCILPSNFGKDSFARDSSFMDSTQIDVQIIVSKSDEDHLSMSICLFSMNQSNLGHTTLLAVLIFCSNCQSSNS